MGGAIQIRKSDCDEGYLIYAPGYFIDAVYPDPFGGYRPYANGHCLNSGHPAYRTVGQAAAAWTDPL